MTVDAEVEERARARLGTTLRGKYRIEEIVGIGGMAVVYRATQDGQPPVAIKMLHADFSMNKRFRGRFLREGTAANSVRHPGVVQVTDHDVADDGAAFLVMELLEGTSVEAFAARSGGKLPVPVACAILDQLLDVLQEAHASNIVHRDIKPGNLFLTHDGTLKLLDFGVARVRDAMSNDASLTATGVLLGTPAFMAPEQARAKSSEIDARTDIWEVGATFFSLVAGRSVHVADTAAQMLIAAATEVPRSVASVAQVPDAIAQVIDRALSFQPAKRWPRAVDMQRALAEACRETYRAPPSRSLLVADAVEGATAPNVPQEVVSAATLVNPSSSATTRVSPLVASSKPPPRPAQRRSGLQVLAVIVTAAAVVAIAIKSTSSSRVEPAALVSPSASPSPAASVSPSTVESSPLPMVSGSAPSAAPTKLTHVHPKACDPPWYTDREGKRIFKKECL